MTAAPCRGGICRFYGASLTKKNTFYGGVWTGEVTDKLQQMDFCGKVVVVNLILNAWTGVPPHRRWSAGAGDRRVVF